MIGCNCNFTYDTILDQEGYFEEEEHAKSHGCTCEWKFITSNCKENCNWGHGNNRRVEEKANCPFHQVMY